MLFLASLTNGAILGQQATPCVFMLVDDWGWADVRGLPQATPREFRTHHCFQTINDNYVTYFQRVIKVSGYSSLIMTLLDVGSKTSS